MIHYIAQLDIRHLGRPLPTLEALKGGRVWMKFIGVPMDAESLALVFYKPNSEERYAPIPCKATPNGDYILKVGGEYFPAVGRVRFEVVGSDGDGESVPMGFGYANVKEFGSGSTVAKASNYVTEIPDEKGILHKVIAVVDEAGQVTWKFIN